MCDNQVAVLCKAVMGLVHHSFVIIIIITIILLFIIDYYLPSLDASGTATDSCRHRVPLTT